MEIKTTTTYTFDLVKEFSVFNIFRIKYYKLIKWIFAMLAVVGLVACVVSAVNYNNYNYFAIEFMIVFVFYFLYWVLPKKAYALAQDLEVNFVFTDDLFFTSSNRPGGRIDSEYSYDQIYILYNTPKYMYLFLNKSQSYIIDKSNIDEKT
ncbi:MAG: YcxB family protein, partial [Oscillospiraceae bacterium]